MLAFCPFSGWEGFLAWLGSREKGRWLTFLTSCRKKAEQAPLREAIKEQRAHDVDVGGVLGQRGGPANPVDKNNYPNTSS